MGIAQTRQGEGSYVMMLTPGMFMNSLLPMLVQSLAPGGVLLYETFACGNETVGRPARADFLLQPGELLTACASLQVVAYENGFLDPPARFVQRIAAVRMPPSGVSPARHPLRAHS